MQYALHFVTTASLLVLPTALIVVTLIQNPLPRIYCFGSGLAIIIVWAYALMNIDGVYLWTTWFGLENVQVAPLPVVLLVAGGFVLASLRDDLLGLFVLPFAVFVSAENQHFNMLFLILVLSLVSRWLLVLLASYCQKQQTIVQT